MSEHPFELTAEHIRAARAMLRLDQSTLAEKAGVSVETIKRLEGSDGPVKAQETTLSAIRVALELLGIELLYEHGYSGVALSKDRSDTFVRSMTESFAFEFRTALGERLRKDQGLLDGPRDKLIESVLESLTEVVERTLKRRQAEDA